MSKKTVLFLTFALLFVLAVLPGCSGCSFWSEPKVAIVNPIRYTEAGGEIWEQISIKGVPTGYQHTVVEKKQDNSEENVFQITQETVIRANRFDQQSQSTQKTIVHQKADGTFLGAQKTVQSANRQPIVTIFEVNEQGKLAIHSTIDTVDGKIDTNATPHTRELDWKPETPGPFALPFSLWTALMQVGESRTVSFFDVTCEEIISIEMKAERIEQISYNNDELNLLRIDAILKNDRNLVAPYTFWTDANGNIVKTVMSAPQSMEIELSTKEKVDADNVNAGNVNVVLQALVPVQGNISKPRETKKVVFRVHWVDEPHGKMTTQAASLVKMFPESAFQTIKEIDNNTVEVTVVSSTQESLSALYGNAVPQSPKEVVADGDTAPNEWVQSDYPSVVQLANAATENTFLPLVAVDIEKFVRDKLQRVDYADSFVAAGDVAQTLKGDSAAFAVLLAAVARVKNIPSRVATGLVYTQTKTGEGVMVFHFWTELYVDGHWHSFDATLGQGGTDASRIILARSSLARESLATLLAPVMASIGHMQVTILETK